MSENPVVLGVDDELSVLDGIKLTLRNSGTVITSTNPIEALEQLGMGLAPSAIISDMRMPQMSGSEFLRRCREVCPDATRILLTGQADLSSAIEAINDGRIFRFLSKPVPPDVLRNAVSDAIEQHDLITSQRVLLEQTLQGSVQAFVEALAVASPISFGKALAVRRLAVEIGKKMNIKPLWRLELASLLYFVSHLPLREQVVQKIFAAQTLTQHEQESLVEGREMLDRMLSKIPRLEDVRTIVKGASLGFHQGLSKIDPKLAEQANVLRAALEYVSHHARLGSPPAALELMHYENSDGSEELMSALESAVEDQERAYDLRSVHVRDLALGMILSEAIILLDGTLLVTAGSEITQPLLLRLEQFEPRTIREPIMVRVLNPRAKAA
ncbi:MAG: response regulator [Armatimonadetes bacterium]|nr:response regulator [Armatimonadota bacterium]